MFVVYVSVFIYPYITTLLYSSAVAYLRIWISTRFTFMERNPEPCKKILTCFLIFLTIYLFDIHYGRKVNNKGANVE